METKCGTRYLNAGLPYGPLCQCNCGRGVEEMEIMSCYLFSKRELRALESSSASVTKLQLLTEKFQLKCQVWLKTCS